MFLREDTIIELFMCIFFGNIYLTRHWNYKLLRTTFSVFLPLRVRNTSQLCGWNDYIDIARYDLQAVFQVRVVDCNGHACVGYTENAFCYGSSAGLESDFVADILVRVGGSEF